MCLGIGLAVTTVISTCLATIARLIITSIGFVFFLSVI